jgi:hypothetical protein
MNEVKIFTQGGLNYDTEPHLVPATDWIDAVNMRIAASDEQQEGAGINIEGCVRIGNYGYHDGINKCIGTYKDEFRNVIYAFICNSLDYDEIIEISVETGVITPVFKNKTWTGLVDVLKLSPTSKIHSVDVIHRNDSEGDLMFWTDGEMPPRKINILKSKNWNQPGGYTNPIVFDYTTVIKKPPRPVSTTWASDLDRILNNLRGKLFQFQVRFVYDDYEKSVWSSWGKYSLPITPFTPNRDSDPSVNNAIDVVLPTGDSLVKKIELGVRQNVESVWGELFLVDTFDKVELSIGDNTTYTYRFYNDTTGVLQLPAETGQLWDYVPTKAGSQALVNGDTIAYGDITEGLSFDDPLEVYMSNQDSVLYPLQPGDNVNGYKHSSKYKFGLVYFDEYNRTDGVHNSQPLDPDRRFEVDTTPYISDSLTDNNYNIYIPKISASIFHKPPVWAKTFKWVRSSYLSVLKYFYYIIRPIATPYQDFIYIPLTSMINSIIENGNRAISYEFTPGDRIRFVRTMYGNSNGPVLSPENLNIDLEITTQVTDPEFDNVIYQGTFLKVRKNTLSMSIKDAPYLVEIYTPSNIVNTDLYYEFGPEYSIAFPGTPSRVHLGQLQTQTSTLPAKFEFITDGDVYYRKREKMDQVVYGIHPGPGVGDLTFPNIPVSDSNYSDKYKSSVNGNGRAYVVDDNTKEQRLPQIIRFGGSYIQDTFINKTNNFPSTNIIDSCDRSFGAIKRLIVRDNQLRVFQELKCGWIPIKQQVLQTTNGNQLVSQSDKLLNDIQYYRGDFGIGNAPCSLSSENFVDYFHDTNRGVICRLSQDGITPISITGKMNRFSITEDVKYKYPGNIPLGKYPVFDSTRPGFAQIYGVFDVKNNTYISAYEEISIHDEDGNRIITNNAKTLAWDEVRNRFISFYQYFPEWMSSLRNDLVTFKEGVPYIHNQKLDGTRCNFYGQQYTWGVTVVFNDKFTIKKTYLAVDLMANAKLYCPSLITSIVNPNIVPTVHQVSNLLDADISWAEGHWHAAILRDLNSPGGILNGDPLKGGYLQMSIGSSKPENLISLYSAAASYIISQKNNE